MDKPHTQAGAHKDDFENRLYFSKKLQALTNKIHATNNLDEIMLDLSRDICDLFECDRLTLYALSKDKEFIYSKVKTGITSNQDLVLPVNSQSIAGYVALTRRAVCIDDVYDEADLHDYSEELKFCRVVDQITSYRTKQMLAAPIVNKGTGELLGVIQLLNNREDKGFSAIAEDGIDELAESMAIAFAQRMKVPAPTVASKYDPLVTDGIISAPEMELAARWARRKNVDIEDALVDEFQVKLSAIGAALAKTFKVPYEGYSAARTRPLNLVKKLTREFVEKNQLLPIAEDQVGLIVLTTDPEHINGARAIKEIFPYASQYYRITTKREFKQTVDQFFGTVYR